MNENKTLLTATTRSGAIVARLPFATRQQALLYQARLLREPGPPLTVELTPLTSRGGYWGLP